MTNFVYDNTALPANKAADINPVTDPTHQWAQADANAVFTALADIRSIMRNGELVAPVVSASQNDYNPTGLADALVLVVANNTGAWNITGIVPPASGRLYVYNAGAFGATLTNQDAASAAANRIIGRAAANTLLASNTGLLLFYRPSALRWIVLADTL